MAVIRQNPGLCFVSMFLLLLLCNFCFAEDSSEALFAERSGESPSPGKSPRVLAVRSCALGFVGGKMFAGDFVAGLAAVGNGNAHKAAAAGRWNRPAFDGRKAEDCITIFTCGFGRPKGGEGQAEAYACQFAGPGGALSKAVRISYNMVFNWNAQAWIWSPPTGELVARFASVLCDKQCKKREPLTLTISEWLAKKEKDLELDTGELPAGLGINELAAIPWQKVKPVIELMSWGAAWKNHLQPGRIDATLKATLKVRMKHRSMDVALTLTGKGEDITIIKRNIPETRLQAFLDRLFMRALRPAGLRDFGALAENAPELLVADSKGIVFSKAGVLTRVNPVTGTQVYPLPPEKGRKQKHSRRSCVYRNGHLLRYSQQVARIDPLTGEETILSSRGARNKWAFSCSDKQSVAFVSGWELLLQAGKKEVWKKKNSFPYTCGPVVAGDKVIAGDEEGRIHAYQLSNGADIWKCKLPQPVYCLSVTGRPPRVYCSDRETLYVLNVATGRTVWSKAIGDTLKVPPFRCGKGILAASKSNVLFLLNPANGKVLHKRKWKSWFREVKILHAGKRERLLVSDNTDNLTLLSPDDLTVLRTFSPGVPLAPGVLAVGDFPVLWESCVAGSSSGGLEAPDNHEVDTAPTILVADRDGFVYLLDLPGGKK